MKLSELKKMIRDVVAEEVRRQLPGALSEMYVRRIVAEERRDIRPAALSHDEERVPEPPPPADADGIYAAKRANPPPLDEHRRRLREGVFGDLFEGTQPIPDDGTVMPTEAMFGPGGVPLAKIGVDVAKVRQLAGIMEKESSNRGPIRLPSDAEERRLEAYRKSLERAS